LQTGFVLDTLKFAKQVAIVVEKRHKVVDMRMRFSLFTLGIVLTVSAVVIGIASNRARISRANQKTIEELRVFKIFAEFEDGTSQQDGRSNPVWSALRIKRIERAHNVISDKALAQIADLRDLRFVQITGPVTDEGLANLKKLHKLEELKIFSSMVTDDGLEKLSHLKSLKSLDLSSSSFTNECLSHLVHLPNLESLSIAGTKITDEGMSGVAKLPQLKHLNIRNTAIGNTGLQKLADAKSLESVEITGSQATYGGLGSLLVDSLGITYGDWFVTEKFVELVGPNYDDNAVPYLSNELPGLTSLRLSSTSLSEKGIRALGKFSQLESLSIKNMDHLDEIAGIPSLERLGIDSPADQPLPRLVDLPNLRKLKCPVGEKQISTIAKCEQLQELEAVDSDLTDDCLKILSGMPNLETLRISGNKVTDEGIAHLVNLLKLQTLYIDCQMVTNASAESFKRMKSLRMLGVFRTNMTKAALKEIETSLPNCEVSR